MNKGKFPRACAPNGRTPAIAWFSCGVTSAIATKLACSLYSNLRVIFIKTGSEEQDSLRFLADCEKWFKHPIEIHQSQKYEDHFAVIRDRKYINGPAGAPCTLELKKKVRWQIEDAAEIWQAQIFGFDAGERKRAIRFAEQNPKAKAVFPLIDRGLTKEDCMSLLRRAKIDLPNMYRLGFHNNNCIGCVKGGKGYWNLIRKHYPETFKKMMEIEQDLGHTCIKDCPLSDLPKVDLPPLVESCSLFCDPDFMYI